MLHFTNGSWLSPYIVRDFDLGQAVITNSTYKKNVLKNSKIQKSLVANLVSNEVRFALVCFRKPEFHHSLRHTKKYTMEIICHNSSCEIKRPMQS